MRKIFDILAYTIVVVVITMAVTLRCADEKRFVETIYTDTTTYVDTIPIVVGMPIESKVVGSNKIRLPKAPQSAYPADSVPDKEITICLTDTDSVEVLAPYIERTYRDSLYEAVVSGYIDPQLKSITVYPTTSVIYKTISKIEYTKKRPYSIGIGIGYGFNGREFSPYVGIGAQYKLFEW